MQPLLKSNPEPDAVLCKALFNAQTGLGLSQTELATTIGVDRSTISRLKTRGRLDPDSKSGELGACVIRIYRALYSLMGGDNDAMKHWMAVSNHHLGGTPRELITGVQGLVQVVEYLDAMRGRV